MPQTTAIAVNELIVPCTATLRDAMLVLDRTGIGIALVVDTDGRLIGTVTDGDVRRALLAGRDMQSDVTQSMFRSFTTVEASAGRAEVLDLMRARTLGQVPVVDNDGRPTGIHTLRQLLGAMPRPNWAVIMAGGRGERLRPLTESIPKPMLKVAGRPILERLVLHLVGFGVQRIFLSVNYLAETIENHFGSGERFGCSIAYLREEQPLGSGGALSLLPHPPTSPLLVMNGDLVTEINVDALLHHHETTGASITLTVTRHAYTVPFGVVETSMGRVTALREKPGVAWNTNAGIYVLSPHLLQRIPHNTPFPMTDLIEDCLRREEPVAAFDMDDEWIDIGQHNELQRARGQSSETPQTG
jgi:dTDP-glucose pyrophosphorylase/predicted transcriptional regulator